MAIHLLNSGTNSYRSQTGIWDFGQGGQQSFDPKGGPKTQNKLKMGGFLLKLPENCMILKISLGQGVAGPPGPPWNRHWMISSVDGWAWSLGTSVSCVVPLSAVISHVCLEASKEPATRFLTPSAGGFPPVVLSPTGRQGGVSKTNTPSVQFAKGIASQAEVISTKRHKQQSFCGVCEAAPSF